MTPTTPLKDGTREILDKVEKICRTGLEKTNRKLHLLDDVVYEGNLQKYRIKSLYDNI
jgi:hypothetical protein